MRSKIIDLKRMEMIRRIEMVVIREMHLSQLMIMIVTRKGECTKKGKLM